MSQNWLADLLGEGSAFNEDTNPDRYKNLVRDIYQQDIGNKKAEYGNLENANIGKAAQTAAQYGISGPAAAALQHTAVQGTEHQANQAVSGLESEQRKANYAAAIKDEETANARAAAKQQAYMNMGQKGFGLLKGALSLAGGPLGWINSATPFFGGLATAVGANPNKPASQGIGDIDTPAIDRSMEPDTDGNVGKGSNDVIPEDVPESEYSNLSLPESEYSNLSLP